jgi:hypothetical protein
MRLLLLDEGFMSGALTAAGMRDAGCTVVVAGAVGGRGRHRARGIDWHLCPAPTDPRFPATVAAFARAHLVDRVWPLTEPTRDALDDASAGCACTWRERLVACAPAAHRPLLASKRRLAEHVARHGVAVPRQLPLPGFGDPGELASAMARAIACLGLPLVIKGEAGRGGCATRIVATKAEALAAWASLRERTTCFAQELVHGATWIVGGTFDHGRPVRLWAAEKLELHPARTGPSIALRSAHAPALVEAALAVFALLQVHGIASADFIRAPDGRFLFLELNARPWGSIAAARAAGVDVFGPMAALLRGERPPADLRWAAGVESRVFPLYLAARPHWRGLRALREAAADLRGEQGALWREPWQAAHLVRRLLGVRRRWPGQAPVSHA